MLLHRPRVDPIEQQRLRRAARANMLIQHPTQHIQPVRIDPPQRLARTLLAPVDQPRLPIQQKRSHPPAQGPHPDTQLIRLRAVAIHHAHARLIAGPRLARQRVIRTAGAIPRQNLAHMTGAFAHRGQLNIGQVGQRRTNRPDQPRNR